MYTQTPCIWLVYLVRITVCDSTQDDPAAQQLLIFKETHVNPIGILSKASGAPVEIREMNTLKQRLIFNAFFMQTMTHFSRERIPERVVHSNGAGAFGYFEVTHDITNICKADLFSAIGKRTPIAVRFSRSRGETGSSELTRDFRGFSIKFYTEEGNFDLVGLDTPVFALKDPLYFPSFTHAIGRNPQTHLFDNTMLWDFISLRPESIHQLLWMLSDFGIPYGYGHMRGFGIHTFQLYNDIGESYFVRFHIYPEWGVKVLSNEEAANITGTDPSFFTHQLYNDIANGNFPSWQINIQVLTPDDVDNADFDVFDVTRVLPEKDYPLRPLGRIVLNRNPKNYFADIEQLAFYPANLVPGILGAPDKLYEVRRFAYGDAQYYRLGANFNNILVNCPFAVRPKNDNYSEGLPTYDRDGRPPVHNFGNAPNYFFNSFNGPVPYKDKNMPDLIEICQSKKWNHDQMSDLYDAMSVDEKTRLVENIVDSLIDVTQYVQERALKRLYKIHRDLGERVEFGIFDDC